jgi:RNA polymerase sigma-70 factor (ECF subfamily)
MRIGLKGRSQLVRSNKSGNFGGLAEPIRLAVTDGENGRNSRKQQMFEQITHDVGTVVLSNLDAAYRLARWHFRTEREAESAVQEASDRAFREYTSFWTETGRVWFLRIVSRVCAERNAQRPGSPAPRRINDVTQLEEAIRTLPAHLREVLVLRELEGLSYQELADLMDVSIDTVTVMLSRSRQTLGRALTEVLVAVEA